MKYWSELSQIETQIIRLETFTGLLRIIALGAEDANHQDVKNALWYIEGSVEDIHNNLRDEFDNLWEMVRNEPEEEVEDRHKGGMKKKKQMTDRELP